MNSPYLCRFVTTILLQVFFVFGSFMCCFAGLLSPETVTSSTSRQTFVIGTNDFLLGGSRFQIRCGEIHAARVPKEYWRQRLKMAKAMGLNTVCAYLFWNGHEPRQGEYVWT